MTTIKLYKDATKAVRTGRHRILQLSTHDDNIIRIIRRMRRLGMIMVKYDEATYTKFTLMQFEKRIRRGEQDGNRKDYCRG